MSIRRIPQRTRRLALATLIGASVALAPSASAQGQDPQGAPGGEQMDPRKMIDLRMARMTELLQLDSAQQIKIRSMIVNETMAMEDLIKNGGGQRGGGGGGRGGGRGGRSGGRRGGDSGGAPPDSTGGGSGGRGPSPEMRALMDSTNKQIEAVLNPKQLTIFRQLLEQGQKQRQAGDSASRRGGGS
jgi:hypothetical protein